MLHFFLTRLATLPLPALRALGTGLGWLLWALSASMRRTVAANLAQAGLLANGGGVSAARMSAPHLSVRRVIQATARGALDMVWVWFNPASAVAARCDVDAASLENMAQALAGTQATLLLTPHLGCFEALAKWIATQTPLTAMYRRPEKPWAAQLIESARNTLGLTMASADAGGVRLALKTLKAGGTLGILPDQAPRHGEGVWLAWFGREAYTITLPAKLHRATGAGIYILAALPCATPRAGWRMVCEPVAVPPDLSAQQLTLHLNQALERMVLQSPHHYAWTYRRYKGEQNKVEKNELVQP